MNTDMLRIIDGICRDRNIEKEQVFADLEQAVISAIRKMAGLTEDVTCTIDRSTGEIEATLNGEPFDMAALGRIAAQTAKQVMIQKIREAERDSIYEEYVERKGQIITGMVSRFEGGALVVSLGRTEGFLPRSEQIPGETHNPGERIRAMILDVRDAVHQVKIILSRTHPDLIRRLFELEVPEVGERVIEMKALAREAGYRTKVAVSSIDTRVDAVGACVGVRGSRIKNIVDELGGEKIDIVRWNESSQILIGNALKPAEVQETALCFELNRATVVVAEDQLSLAIGKRGQNVRLAARLTGWDIDILTPAEYNKGLDDMEKVLRPIEGVEDLFFSKMIAMGIINLMDIEEIGADPLIQEVGLEQEVAEKVLEVAAENAKRIAQEMEAAKLAKQQADEAAAAAEATAEAESPEAEGAEEAEPAPVDEASPAETEEQPSEPVAVVAAEVEPTSQEEAPVESAEAEPASPEVSPDVAETDASAAAEEQELEQAAAEPDTEPDEPAEAPPEHPVESDEPEKAEPAETAAPIGEQETLTKAAAEAVDDDANERPVEVEADSAQDESGDASDDDAKPGQDDVVAAADQGENPKQ